MVKRGEVWLVALDPTVGSEIQKTRPCIVISPPEIHDFQRTAIVAPMATAGHPAPYRVQLTFARKRGLVLLDQLRTVDKARLVARLGAVSPQTLERVSAVLTELFTL